MKALVSVGLHAVLVDANKFLLASVLLSIMAYVCPSGVESQRVKIVHSSYSGPNRTHTFCHSLQPWARWQPAARPMRAASCSF